jgi:hypothetical protein
MVFCSRCGQRNDDEEVVFCTSCGNNLKDGNQGTVAPAPAAAPPQPAQVFIPLPLSLSLPSSISLRLPLPNFTIWQTTIWLVKSRFHFLVMSRNRKAEHALQKMTETLGPVHQSVRSGMHCAEDFVRMC